MNTRQLLAIEYLNQFGEDIIFKNSYEFYIKGKRGEYIFQKYGDRDDNSGEKIKLKLSVKKIKFTFRLNCYFRKLISGCY